jgi:UDP-2,4-diacetamido-2,4,6-trideoxy-beta-L-altropyranose hydrolase
LTDFLIIRADAFVRLGTGHVMRCLALAQAAKKFGGKIIFVTTPGAVAVENRLKGESFEILHQPHKPGSRKDAEWTAWLATKRGARWIAVDGYHFNDNYQKILKNKNLKLLFIDDWGHCEYYYADYVLNQNIYASESIYPSKEPYTKLLLGPKFALLRQEFDKYREFQRKTPDTAERILITLGGSDPDNISTEIIKSLEPLSQIRLEIKLIVGGANPHFEKIRKATEASSHKIKIIRDALNMPELMAWADLAVSGAGSSCWELCMLGLPAIVMVLADNQKPISESLERAGAAIPATPETIAEILEVTIRDGELRKKISEKQKQIIDGKGAERAVAKMDRIKIRNAEEKDREFVWKLSNDPKVRSLSFSSSEIPWKDHVKWFKSKLDDTLCRFFIIENVAGLRIGQARSQKHKNEATVSISIQAEFRGLGYGTRIVSEISKAILNENDVSRINALIKPSNKSSINAFQKAGYLKKGKNSVKDKNDALLFVMENEI